jgi:hypothetical protein
MRIFTPKEIQPEKPVPSSFIRSTAAGLRSNHDHKTGLNDKPLPSFGPDFSRIPIDPPAAAPPSILIQRKPGHLNEPTDRKSQKEENKKAELEFHSTIAFVGTNSGSSSTGPSQEGFSILQIKWLVWNSGWEDAPAHMDRMTIYHADRCSGCRDEKDEMLKAEVAAPATRPIAQPGDGEYRYESISPMVAMTIRAGHYDVYVDLDVYDEVEEINEDNNTIFTSFYVRPPDKSDSDTEAEEENTGSR